MSVAAHPQVDRHHRRWLSRTFLMVAAAMLLGSGVSSADEPEGASEPVEPAASTQVTEVELTVIAEDGKSQDEPVMSTDGTRIG